MLSAMGEDPEGLVTDLESHPIIDENQFRITWNVEEVDTLDPVWDSIIFQDQCRLVRVPYEFPGPCMREETPEFASTPSPSLMLTEHQAQGIRKGSTQDGAYPFDLQTRNCVKLWIKARIAISVPVQVQDQRPQCCIFCTIV